MFVGMLAMQSATAQSRVKKAQTERNVGEAINADHYKINVDYMQPMKGPQPRHPTTPSKSGMTPSFLPALLRVAYNVPRRREGIDI